VQQIVSQEMRRHCDRKARQQKLIADWQLVLILTLLVQMHWVVGTWHQLRDWATKSSECEQQQDRRETD
jgi:hypothetical protein